MKKFMITAAMAAMLITTAAEYGSVVNVMAAASSTTKTAEKKTTKTTTKTTEGCNSYPIMDDDKTVAEDEIQISYDFLKESSDIFTNWKRK